MKALIPFVIVGLCVGMYFMYISPLVGEISIKRGELAQYVSALDRAKELKTQRDTAIAAYNNISESDTAKLNKIIPDKFDGVLFLNNINATAFKNGLSIKEFRADAAQSASREPENPEADNTFYKKTTINMKVSGQYEQFLAFLKDVERNLQLVDVVSLSVTGDAGAGAGQKVSSGALQYALVINTYSMK